MLLLPDGWHVPEGLRVEKRTFVLMLTARERSRLSSWASVLSEQISRAAAPPTLAKTGCYQRFRTITE